MSQETKHARRPNCSQDEVILMCKFINEKKHVIRAKFLANVSTQSKKTAWDHVTTQLNASFPSVKRDRTEVEKKWHNVYSKSKKELTEHSKNSVKTGGGPPPKPLGIVSQAVADIIGEDNVCVQRIGDDILDSSYYQVTSFNEESTSASEVLNLDDICVFDAPMPTPIHVTNKITKSHYSNAPDNDVNEKKKIKLEIENLEMKKENEYLKLKLIQIKQQLIMSPEN